MNSVDLRLGTEILFVQYLPHTNDQNEQANPGQLFLFPPGKKDNNSRYIVTAATFLEGQTP